MTLFEPGRPGDLKTYYGYLSRGEDVGLDSPQSSWDRYKTSGWHRPFELVLKKPKTCVDRFTPETLQEFHEVCRYGFQYIARRHNLTPQVMWMKVQAGLEVFGMHQDDIQAVEQFLWGWIDFSLEEMERFRWRYPERCPLMDTLCSLDWTCERLNRFQDFLLEMKGSNGRRRNDVLPPLPDVDGVREPKRERVAGSISYSQLLCKERS